MDFATPIITPIVQSLLLPVKKHLDFLVSCTTYVRDMISRIKELEGAAGDVLTKQESFKANSLMVPQHVPKWLEEVGTITDTAKRISAAGVGYFNIKNKYKIGKQCSEIMKVINRLMKERGDMVWNHESIPLAMAPSLRLPAIHEDNYQNKNIIRSRDLMFNEALKSLESNNKKTQKMAICGMAGVGKTTMMEKLKKAATDRRMFDWIVKLETGQDPNIDSVQQTIAEYIGEGLTEKNKYTRAERLQKRIEGISAEGNKKFLFILDDVWEDFDLKDIGLTSTLPNGIKLLVTSREETVCTRMGIEASSILKMVVLEEPEAKQIFWEIVGVEDGGDIEPDLHDIGQEIVKSCGGLPIAINTIASTLRYIKEKNEWKDALYRIQNKDFKVLVDIFEPSYKNIKDDDLKSILLLSGLFPMDYDIIIEDLVMYGWGLNFHKNLRKIAIARIRVNTCVNKLIRSNLLIKSDQEGCVKMHDLVRNFVLSKCSEVRQACIVNHGVNISHHLKEDECYDRILISCRGLLEFPIDFKHLEDLKLLKIMDGDNLHKFPKDFYTLMQKLEVVAYDNIHLHLVPHCSTLRSLSLHSCSLMIDISFLGDLINLEVLRLVNCGIRKLPSEIGKLKRLKLLDLTGCTHLHIDHGVFDTLLTLEELYMRVSNKKAIMFTDANYKDLEMMSMQLSSLEVEFFSFKAQLKDVSFTQLERFRISVGSPLEMVDDLYSFKNTLQFVTGCNEIHECRFNELFSKTEILHLKFNDMKHLEDVSMHPPQHSFRNLRALHVSRCTNLTYLFTCEVAKGLRKLEKLEIFGCYSLKEIWSCEIASFVDYISMLRNIKVEYCDNIVNLFPHNPMRFLSHLEELTVKRCDSIKALFNIDFGQNDQHTNLRIIQVDHLNSLKEVWRVKQVENDDVGVVIHSFQAVKSLDIRNCVRFRNIVTPTTTKFDMTMLKEINISNKLVEKKINSSNEERLKGGDDKRNVLDNLHHVGMIEFYSLTTIKLESCENIKYLFSTLMVKLLSNLKEVRIISSTSIEEVVSNRDDPRKDEEITASTSNTSTPLFPHLDILHLISLSNLKHIGMHKLPNLKILNINDCGCLEEIFTFSALQSLKNLEILTITKCKSIKVIVRQDQTTKSSMDVTFPHLKSLKLENLPNLAGFFLGKNVNFYWPSLDDVRINYCPQMTVFTYGHSTSERLKYIHTELGKHITDCGLNSYMASSFNSDTISLDSTILKQTPWSFHSLIESRLEEHNLCNVFSSNELQHLQMLETIYAKDCSNIEEVFEVALEVISDQSKTVTKFPKLREMYLNFLSSLKYLWKSNQWRILEFPNLTRLSIFECHSLEHVFTSSMVSCVMQLQEIHIQDCCNMKVVIKEEEYDVKMSEIMFPFLKSLKLESLLSVEGLYLGKENFIFSSLDTFVIKECPRMMVFTKGGSIAPKLKIVETSFGSFNGGADICSFIMTVKEQMPSTSLDSISSHPIILKGKPLPFNNLIKCNLNHNYKHKKIFTFNELEKLQKLETIYAEECSYVEEIFEVEFKMTNNKSQAIVILPLLRKVELVYLPRLSYIWKSNQLRILEFPNLTTLSINNCENIKHVFSCSMVGCVMQLQELCIIECKNMEVIVDHSDAKGDEIMFPQLKSIRVNHLQKLEGFYLGKEDLKLELLDTLVISDCPKITVFTKGRVSAPKLAILETGVGSFLIGDDINSFMEAKENWDKFDWKNAGEDLKSSVRK